MRDSTDRAANERLAEQRRAAIEAVARTLHQVPDHHSIPSHVVDAKRAAVTNLELTLGAGDGPIADLVRAASGDQFEGHEWPVEPADVAVSLLFEWHRGEVTSLGAFKRYFDWIQAQRERRDRDPAASLEP